MLKKWAGFICVTILLAVIGLLAFWRQPADGHSETSAPVIVTQAEVVSQGVRVVWLEAQPNPLTISGYAIERSRDHSNFTQIGRVEKKSLQYLDAEGRNGDRYRVVSVGAQHSKPSEPITAALPKPGSNFVVASLPSSRVLGSTTPNSQADTPAEQVIRLKSAIDTAFADLDSILASRNFTETASYLHALQNYQHESLLLLPNLSPAEKASLAQACADHANNFEAILHILPEDSQMDGMLVAAGCDAMQEGAAQ